MADPITCPECGHPHVPDDRGDLCPGCREALCDLETAKGELPERWSRLSEALAAKHGDWNLWAGRVYPARFEDGCLVLAALDEGLRVWLRRRWAPIIREEAGVDRVLFESPQEAMAR